MASGKNKNLIFRTKKERSKNQLKKFSLAILAFVVVFGSISLLYFLKTYNFDIKFALAGSQTETSESASEQTSEVAESSTNILLYCGASDRSALYFVSVVRIDMPEGEIRICSLPASCAVTVSGKQQTLAAVFASGGVKALKTAVEGLADIRVNRYIGSTENTFKSTVNYLGGFDIDVKTGVEYRKDFDLLLVRGEQELKGDSLLKYIRYLGTLGGDGMLASAGVMGEIINEMLSPDYAAKAQSIYSRLANNLDTDISIVDFSAAGTAINSLMQKGGAQFLCTGSLEELCGDTD